MNTSNKGIPSYLTALAFCLCALIGHAQMNNIDSLNRLLERETNEQKQIDLKNHLSEAYFEKDYHEAVKIAYEALQEAGEANYQEGIWHACNNLGIAFDYLGKNDSAYFYYRRGVDLAIDIGIVKNLAVSKNNLGVYYLFRGNYPIALQYLQEALDLDADVGDMMNPALTLANIGVIHEEMGDTLQAFDYYRRSAEFALSKEEEDKTLRGFAFLSYGYIAHKEGRFADALQYYEKALAIYQDDGQKVREAETLYYLGLVCMDTNMFERALQYERESLAIYEKQGSADDIPAMYATIAKIYANAGKEKQAIHYYQQAEAMAKQVDSPTDLVAIYDALAKIYAKRNQFKEAYENVQRYRAVNDTIFGRRSKDRINEMEIAYNFKVKQLELDRLKAEKAKQQIILQQRTILAAAALLIAVLVAILAAIYARANRQKSILNEKLERKVTERTQALEQANQRLLQSNEELERFTYLASHDLKEPLRNISSFVNLIQRRLKNQIDTDIQDYLEFVIVNTKRMYGLVEDVLALSRLNAVGNKQPDLIDPEEVLGEVLQGMRTLLQEKGALVEVGGLPSVKVHKAHLFLIFKNLIENGLKYNESAAPQVWISYEQEENKDKHLFKVKDNGIGIPARYHKQIFEMFQRLNSREKYTGSGMGLAICQKIIHRYHGEIGVCSEEGKGSTFFFSLPVTDE